MKKLIFSAALLSLITLSACNNEVDTKMCEEHVKNCPKSENCPEHPECEAHEQCAKDKECKDHPTCAAFDKKKDPDNQK